ncbi:MAG: hypothetical protein VX075_02820 [Pseudomonadota bacterium]|nr:hypothetical protein [Pseudomonadota bacterium]MEC8698742.1 hypothetical protein [Pseudomonadota bacterium]|tara:strand:- start:374 stop:610 length:237 start_codon:yes stop_codon:yes gene_type:complete
MHVIWRTAICILGAYWRLIPALRQGGIEIRLRVVANSLHFQFRQSLLNLSIPNLEDVGFGAERLTTEIAAARQRNHRT